MQKVLAVLFVMSSTVLPAQTGNLNEALIKASLASEYKTKPAKRKLLSLKTKGLNYNPFAYAGAGLLFFYQNVISEQIQSECTYVTSCSEFTKQSIQENGFITGILMGFNQLTECHPSAIYEHPPLFIEGKKIKNQLAKED